MNPVRLEQSRTRDFVRATIARAVNDNNDEAAAEYARGRWGAGCPASLICSRTNDRYLADRLAAEGLITRATVSNTEVSDTDIGAADPAAVQFFAAVAERTIIGRLPGVRRVPFNLRLITSSGGAAGYFVGENAAIPMSRASLLGSSIPTARVAGLMVTSKEALQAVGSVAESIFERDLIRAITLTTDARFIDPANTGGAGVPASITASTASAASTGDVASDIELLIENFAGDLTTAAIVTSPWVAVRIALQRDSTGSLLFPDLGAAGGSLLNFPLITSRAVPADTSGGLLALVDGAGIAVASEAGTVSMSEQAMIELNDAPQGRSDTPVASSATLVPLFQTESVGIKHVQRVNWEVQRAGSVSTITGAGY